MPMCYNNPLGEKPRYFKGTEKTPLGRGISPYYERIGSQSVGLDGRMYMVGYAGINRKRWIFMWWLGNDA